MKKVIFLILFIGFLKSYSQEQYTELVKFAKTKSFASQFENIKNQKFDSIDILTTYKEVSRSLDFGYIHHRHLIISHHTNEMRIDIISKNDTIVFGTISVIPWKRNKIKTNTIFNGSEGVFLKNYLLKHKKLYKGSITKKEFIEQLINEYTVGFGCGIVGLDIPDKSALSENYVKRKNRIKLNYWLRSFSPELQTLGAIGIIKLKKISSEELRIIKHLQKRNTIINTCMGCIYGFQETFNDRVKLKK